MDRHQQEQEPIEFKGGRLTALSVQKANPDRLSVFIDDQFMLGVRREVIIRHGLIKKGMEVTTEQLWALWREEQTYKARDLAAKYLTARARSTQQVADYLAGKEFDEQVVGQTIEWLTRMGYVDDSQYARMYVENRLRFKPRGKAMLRWELKQKGVSTSDIDAALAEELSDPEVEVAAAVKILQKKVGRKMIEFTYEERAKLAQHLARKGFSGGVISQAMNIFRQGANLDND